MTKKAILIDDERLARNELRKMLADYPDIEIVDEAGNVEEGLEKNRAAQSGYYFSRHQYAWQNGF